MRTRCGGRFSKVTAFAVAVFLNVVTPVEAAKFDKVLAAANAEGHITGAALKALKQSLLVLDKAKRIEVRKVVSERGKKVGQGWLKGEIVLQFARLPAQTFTLVAHSGGSVKTTFLGIGPKKPFSFSDAFGSNDKTKKLLKVFDIIRYENQILLISGGGIALKSGDIPSQIRKDVFDKFYGAKDYTLDLSEGLAMFGNFSLEKAKKLDELVKKMGGKSSRIYTKVAIQTNAVAKLFQGQAPGTDFTVRMTGDLPKFAPVVKTENGRTVKFPAMQFSLLSELSFDPKTDIGSGSSGRGVKLGFNGGIDVFVGKGDREQKVPFDLEVAVEQPATGPPKANLTGYIYKGEPWKEAFRIPFLTISDYYMKLGSAGDTVSMEAGGKTSFFDKNTQFAARLATSAKTSGIPYPEYLMFKLDEGPDKVGELALADFANGMLKIMKARGKRDAKLPPRFPDVAIAGTAKGKGPEIALNLETGGNLGISGSGKLRLLGTDIATIKTLSFKADQGLVLDASAFQEINAGPINLPKYNIKLVSTLEKVNGKYQEPRLDMSYDGWTLFDKNKRKLTLVANPRRFELRADREIGELFKFRFHAYTEGSPESLAELRKLDFRLGARVSSDFSKWLKESGLAAVRKAASEVKKQSANAKAELDERRKNLANIDNEIAKIRKEIEQNRESRDQAIRNAEAKVKELKGKISDVDKRIRSTQAQIKTCNQTKTKCIWGAREKSCKKYETNKRGKKKCVDSETKWVCKKKKTFPALSERGVCQAKNTKPRFELVGLQTYRGQLIAAEKSAATALQALRGGLEMLPPELNPRLSGLLAARETAKAGFELAERSVDAYQKFFVMIDKVLGEIAGKADFFAIENALITGSLRAAVEKKPVIIDANFRILGKSHHNKFAFSIHNHAYSADQLVMIAFWGFSKRVLELAQKDLKIIPDRAVEKLRQIVAEKEARVNAELEKALAANKSDHGDEKKINAGAGRAVASLFGDLRKIQSDAGAAHVKATALRQEQMTQQTQQQIQKVLDQIKQVMAALSKPGGSKPSAAKPSGGGAASLKKFYRVGGANTASDLVFDLNGVALITQGTGKEEVFSRKGSSWQRISGLRGTRIAHHPLGIFALSKANDVYFYSHKTKKTSKYLNRKAIDIAAAKAGQLWMVEPNGTVWFTMAKPGPVRVKLPWLPGGINGAKRIAVGPGGGGPCIVKTGGDVWCRSPTAKKWGKVGSKKATDIAISANHHFFMLSNEKTGGGYLAYQRVGNAWKHVPGVAGTRIAVAPDGHIAVINTGREVWASRKF